MKKVLFAINNLEGGGAEKVLVDLVNNLNKKKYTVDLFLIDKTGVFLEKLDKAIENSNRTNRMKALDNPNNKRAAAFLRVLIKEEKSLSEMARILNKEGFVTSQGKEFKPSQVSVLIKRYGL